MYTDKISKLVSLINLNNDELQKELTNFKNRSNIKSENQLIAFILFFAITREKIAFTEEDLKEYFGIEYKNILHRKVNKFLNNKNLYIKNE